MTDNEYRYNVMSMTDNEYGYNVMLLTWSDGLAERRGIGFAKQEDFIAKCLPPGAEWKEIVLG